MYAVFLTIAFLVFYIVGFELGRRAGQDDKRRRKECSCDVQRKG